MAVVCHSNDIAEGDAKGFTLGEELGVIVLRQNGQLRVYHNRCPHLGVPLEWLPDQFMDAEQELLRCATHGALFLPESGECVAGPCTGQYLRELPFELKDGWIELPVSGKSRG